MQYAAAAMSTAVSYVCNALCVCAWCVFVVCCRQLYVLVVRTRRPGKKLLRIYLDSLVTPKQPSFALQLLFATAVYTLSKNAAKTLTQGREAFPTLKQCEERKYQI